MVDILISVQEEVKNAHDAVSQISVRWQFVCFLRVSRDAPATQLKTLTVTLSVGTVLEKAPTSVVVKTVCNKYQGQNTTGKAPVS